MLHGNFNFRVPRTWTFPGMRAASISRLPDYFKVGTLKKGNKHQTHMPFRFKENVRLQNVFLN